jgi:hypothetical protein
MKPRDMPRIMRRFRILEISGVDRSAQQGADVRIFKRQQEDTKVNTQATIEQTGRLAETVLDIKTQAPRRPTDKLTPLFERFTRRPGAIRKRRQNLSGI